jgi:hypothetical protein
MTHLFYSFTSSTRRLLALRMCENLTGGNHREQQQVSKAAHMDSFRQFFADRSYPPCIHAKLTPGEATRQARNAGAGPVGRRRKRGSFVVSCARRTSLRVEKQLLKPLLL